MSYLLSGSLSYDAILLHKGLFHHRILPESIARLNVSFGIDSSKTEFGGTAGNIAYNASLLGANPCLIASVGSDNCKLYVDHLNSLKINTEYLNYVQNEVMANAWILTDLMNNQITGFYKGAMCTTPNIPDDTPNLWHLSPEYIITMASFAKEAIKRNKKYFFDPGQALPSFIEGGSENIFPLAEIIRNASGCFVNEYEGLLLEEKFGVALGELIAVSPNMEFFVKTLGASGVELFTKDGCFKFDVIKPLKVTDPTGCGDAFRAGFIDFYLKNKSLSDCVRLGSVMGSFAVEGSGGQSHKPTKDEIMNRFVNG